MSTSTAEQASRYQRTGLIEDMTNPELAIHYRLEMASPARERYIDIDAGARAGNRRRARAELVRLDRRLAIMRRVADERGINIATGRAA